MPRILGIDFGEKRTGIAVTDPLQIISGGLTTVATEQLMDFLKQYLEQESVERFVIGYPLTLRNEPADVIVYVDAFIAKLKQAFPHIPVSLVDERYTSAIAQRAMIDGGLKKKSRQNKSLIDKVSASLILQTYLERTKK